MTILTLPRLGETMEEARVTDWLVAPGAAFKRGDVLLEVETDKTVVEVPALQDGTLMRHLVVPGEMVALDQPIAEIVTASGAAPAPARMDQPSRAAPAPQIAAIMTPEQPPRPAASPRARAIARRTGKDLATLTGSGRNGRITGADVANSVSDGRGVVATSRGEIAFRRVAGSDDAEALPVVLLHGLFDDGRGWRDLPQRLSRAGHPVVAFDLPGHGDSQATADDAGAVAGVMAEAVATLVGDGPLVLVGHSFGAVVAAHLAAKMGARITRLVLIAPAGLGATINGDFLGAMSHAETPAALQRALRVLGSGPVSDSLVLEQLTQLQRIRPRMAHLAQSLASAGFQQIDIAPVLATLNIPIIAVFGLSDRIIAWGDCASLPARAAIHLVPDAGHQPHLTAPDLIADLISGAPRPASGRTRESPMTQP